MLGRGLKIEKNISRKESSGKRSAITPGLIPARKGTFLFGEKYSLDRGPLMGDPGILLCDAGSGGLRPCASVPVR